MLDIGEYQKLIARNPEARQFGWSRMVRDAEVYARGEVRTGITKRLIFGAGIACS